MAEAVARTIAAGGALVVEAGTGVGKTFAYLVPALLSGERVLISTATKALQDQLFTRDLPRLLATLGVPLRAALLKGRASYLCQHRLERAGQGGLHDPQTLRALAQVQRWAGATESGDLAELPALDERSPVLPLVTSTRENCLGSACTHWAACHVNRARQRALAADVVVVNHHLFFADLAVRESGMAELLPSVRVVVFDEAHQLNATGVQFLGVQAGTGALLAYARDVLAASMATVRGMADWLVLCGNLERAARDLRLAAGRAPGRRAWRGEVPDGVNAAAWRPAMQGAAHACREVVAALDAVREAAPELARLHERGAELMQRMARFAAASAPEAVRWLDAGAQLRFVESPLDIADTVRTRLLGEEGKAWIFTSATLGDDARLSWFTEPCGLEDADILRVDSPFDYAHQAALYVPRDLPEPASPEHSPAVAALAARAARRLGGRTLVLTTTLKALHAIGEALRARLDGIDVLVQGQAPKHRLLERFRQDGCVLVASASFWEGVDVPGHALQLVVIDKLPFPPPGDPLVDARTQRLEAAGRSAFRDHALPEAAVALKQGAGRLIRHESDQGLLVVCDPRLARMGYGKRLLAALPPMRRLASAQAFDAALEDLASVASASSDVNGG
ncbi:MAG: ATP-dependent DNA helicase [Acidovorax sp.]